MSLNKYKGFIAGDKLPAENVNSIDPDNIITTSAAGYLTGGSNVSALSVFQALGSGSNDGKISINIDGVEYDDLNIDLSLINLTPIISQELQNSTQYIVSSVNYLSQSFLVGADTYIGSIDVYFYLLSSPIMPEAKLYLADSSGLPTGAVLAQGTPKNTTPVNGFNTFDFGITLITGTEYCLVLSGGSDCYWKYYASNVYADGNYGISTNSGATFTADTSRDFCFRIFSVSTISGVAGLLQNSIRLATGSTETVVYDTDHFVITSATTGGGSRVLKLISPSTGTDITGNATELYLDLGANAIATQGTGEAYNLLRLNGGGAIPSALIPLGVRISVYLSTGLYVNPQTKTLIIFDQVDFDINGEYDNATGKFTASEDGYYQINVSASGQNGTFTLYVDKNGTNHTTVVSSESSAKQIITSNAIIQMNSGDYLEISYLLQYWFNNVGGTRDTHLDISKIG